MFKASDLEMELRSLFHLNHSVVLPYSVFIRSIVSDLPFRGLNEVPKLEAIHYEPVIAVSGQFGVLFDKVYFSHYRNLL